MCRLSMQNVGIEGKPISHGTAIDMLNGLSVNDAVFKIHSLLKCKAEITSDYVFGNYKDDLDEYISLNLSYVTDDGKFIKRGKTCTQSAHKRKMAELLTSFFSLINFHPEVVE